MADKEKESVSPEHHHNCRPLCPCCGGGDYRKGYRYTKAGSRRKNTISKRAKPKYKDKRS